MLGHGLAGAEAAGDGGGAALGHGEEGVDDPLPGDEGGVGIQPSVDRPGGADGPFRAEGELMEPSGIVPQGYHRVPDLVSAVGLCLHDHAAHAVRDHAAVGDDGGFRAGGVDFARHQTVAGLDGDRHLPFPVLVQRGYGDAPADEIAGFLLDGFQRALDAVEYIVQNAGTQQGAQGAAGGIYRLAAAQAGGVFVYLDGGGPVVDADDLAHQLFLAYQDHFHHGEAGVAQDGDHRAVYAVYAVVHPFSRLSEKR